MIDNITIRRMYFFTVCISIFFLLILEEANQSFSFKFKIHNTFDIKNPVKSTQRVIG